MALCAIYVFSCIALLFKLANDFPGPVGIQLINKPDFRVGLGKGYLANASLGIFIQDA